LLRRWALKACKSPEKEEEYFKDHNYFFIHKLLKICIDKIM